MSAKTVWLIHVNLQSASIHRPSNITLHVTVETVMLSQGEKG